MGPLCDMYGARILFAWVLCLAAIPTACTGFIQTSNGLVLLRLCIGLAGSSFVMCQYWTSRMFTKEVVGTANALVGGWGNLGAGVTQLVMGSILFPVFKSITNDGETAWRTVCIVPAGIAFATGITIYYISDDCPKGNYSELKQHRNFPNVTIASSFTKAACNANTWLLFLQYACCFGVELTMNNAAALYFRDEFGQSTEAASAIAAIFGWLNLFARGLGGFASDACNYRNGMRGRIVVHTIFLLFEGIMAAEGSSYAIVPYIDPPNMGSVSGIIGAGGNVGAVGFGFCFRQLNYSTAFDIMGFSIITSSLLSALIHIRGFTTMFGGKERRVDKETGKIVKKIVPPAEHVGETVEMA
eukprot:scaffold46516_cov183-Amphora_coffeaeformis.AAC.1